MEGDHLALIGLPMLFWEIASHGLQRELRNVLRRRHVATAGRRV